MSAPLFTRLSIDWNAQPNAPRPLVRVYGTTVVLSFAPNRYQFPDFAKVSRSAVSFEACSRYRLTPVNDEGWYRGQCRFSKLAPHWGEFYRVDGDTMDEAESAPWAVIAPDRHGAAHYHFYLRDETFEAKAIDWDFHRDVSLGEAE